MNRFLKSIVLLCGSAWLLLMSSTASAFSHGIYVTQSTAQNKSQLMHLIQQSKKYGIDTFIIDVNNTNKRYAENVKTVVQSGIHYVARVVIFPHGGTHAQVMDKNIWNKRLALAKYAVSLGASAIQLDYIRYRAENPPNPQKAKNILKVVQFFKEQLASSHVALQMDVFGIATLKPAHTIGQDLGLLSQSVDAICPMVYPSHYEPYKVYSEKPYETIFNAVKALKKQIPADKHVSIFAYIESYNYRYPMSHEKRLRYIASEMKGARDSGADGWYVWSANNRYQVLFEVLANRSHAQATETEKKTG